ncbi:MAG TPA: ABC transporter permease [Bradyrhizobium sp.]|nr:ABC transporter permease [Bradyrhizobium sp.]
MARFIGKRLAIMLITLVAASFLVFAVSEFTPGSVARKTLGPYANQEQVDILSQRLRSNDPLLIRYTRWLGIILGLEADPLQDKSLGLGFTDPRGARYFGNLGYSTLYKLPVNDVIWDRLSATGLLAGLSFALIVPLSLVVGVASGVRIGSKLDRGLSATSIVLTSIPEFASGVFLTAFFVVLLGWLPGTSPLSTTGGWSVASQMVLPVAVLVLYDFGYVARMIRASVAEVVRRPYVRTATLKGLSRRKVIMRHVLRNAMIAPFTVLLLQVNFLLSGVVVTELVFAYPGFGRMLLEASLFGDISVIEAATLVTLTIAILCQLIGDLGYMVLNPRIRIS